VRRGGIDRPAAVPGSSRGERGPLRTPRLDADARGCGDRHRWPRLARVCGRTGHAATLMRHLAAIVACVLGGAVLLSGAAEAHANYVRSNPAADARLVKAPAEIRIEFSEPPDPRGSDIEVLDTNGVRHDKHDVALSGDPNGLRVSVDPIPDGGYLVAWTATSAVDGHTTKGNFAFVIGKGPLPPVPQVAEAAPPPPL